MNRRLCWPLRAFIACVGVVAPLFAVANPFSISCAALNAENIANGTANASGYTTSAVLPGVNNTTGIYSQTTSNLSIQAPPNGIICVRSWTGSSSTANYTLTFLGTPQNAPITILVEEAADLSHQRLVLSGAAPSANYSVGVNHLGGKGGPGGADGGSCDFAVAASRRAGDGVGPGGGRGSISSGGGGGAGPTRAGAVGFGSAIGAGGSAPSSFDHRILHGGSGGGCGAQDASGTIPTGGGGGGGAIVMAAGTFIDTGASSYGAIDARGGFLGGGGGGGGGGGLVRLISPIIRGNGSLDVRGGGIGANCGTTLARGGCGASGLVKLEGLDVGGAFVNTAISLNGKDSVRYGTALPAVLPSAQLPRAQIIALTANFDGSVESQVPAPLNFNVHALQQVSVHFRSEQQVTATIRTWHVPDDAVVKVKVNAVDPAPGISSQNIVVVAGNPSGAGIQRDWTAVFTIPAGAKVGTIEAWIDNVCTPGTAGCPAVQ